MNLAVTYLGQRGSWGDFLARALRKRANVVTFGPVIDARHDVPTDLRPDVRRLWPLLEARLGRVDWLLYIDLGVHYLPRRLEQVPCPSAAYLVDTKLMPHWHRYLIRFFDLIFQFTPSWVGWCCRGRQQAFWLPGAADPETFRKLNLEKRYDVGFVGQYEGPRYETRRLLLERLERQFAVYHGRGTVEDTVRVYNQSRIVFNYTAFGEMNLRFYEALACGSLLVTNRLPLASRLEELFLDRQHLVLYDNADELVELVDYYLRHEEEREQIAAAGYQRVRAAHTWDHRAEQILARLRESPALYGARCSTARERLIAAFEAEIRTRPRLHRAWLSLPHPFLPWCGERVRRLISRSPMPPAEEAS